MSKAHRFMSSILHKEIHRIRFLADDCCMEISTVDHDVHIDIINNTDGITYNFVRDQMDRVLRQRQTSERLSILDPVLVVLTLKEIIGRDIIG